MNAPVKVIAIDGPSGSGKSTIAKLLSQKLNLMYLDTGALFRSIAWGLDQENIDESELQKIQNYLDSIELKYAPTNDILVELNGIDVSLKIREHHVSGLASKYSKVASIRTYLKELQRSLASSRSAILEGRDIGTVIFPDAALKFFLVADPNVRARRRYDQLKQLGKDVSEVSVESIAEDIVKRDQADSAREIAPLTKAADAIEIDTSELSLDAVIEQIMSHFNQKKDLFS